MRNVLVPLACGFEEIEAVSIIDILRRGHIEVIVACLDDKTRVQGANGIVIEADSKLENVNTSILDMIVLPGGWDGTYALADDVKVQEILKEMDKNDKYIAAICAAPFALNKAGVLKQNFTCYPSVEEKIRLEGYQGDKQKVVIDENIITSRGPATAICFALELVKILKGQEMYESVKNGVLADFC